MSSPEPDPAVVVETTQRSSPRAWWARPWVIATSAVVALIVAGCLGGLTVHLASSDSGTGPPESFCSARDVADMVLPSVVTIAVHAESGSGNGSGELIRSDGYVLTNDHVIASGASGGEVSVIFSSGTSEQAAIVGRAPQLDLAVLKVEATTELPVIGKGDSDALDVGQPVVALGAPLGLEGSVTAGIVSALGRDVSLPGADGITAQIPGAIQTDASINPGNSGGALVDCTGKLVGVNTAIATVPNATGERSNGSVGIGFAIPAALAYVVADQLIDHGRFTPPTAGISTLPIPPAVADRFDVTDGLYVRDVVSDGPADHAGLATGDVITHIDGAAASRPDALVIAVLTKKPGDRLEVDYLRDGAPRRTAITLAAGPQ